MKTAALAAALALAALAPAFAEGTEQQFIGTPERVMTQSPREFAAPMTRAVRQMPMARPTAAQAEIDRNAVPPGI
ncbi:hypothetical protein E8L99_05920 [Phreatobacter aquaticus]|uniref:Uncharacterized protein n=1 Tax=Phreatobacter aquaticus TaxID=2570229 RepID=A0A4D7QFC0_9HYPH|nr:hypothetical protein [Phreatobacter aquaticus]QCK85341.1 hypothetical protein E8L99_05920 [Phreatobacter aquaticus]